MNLITTPWLPFTAADGAHPPTTPAGVLDPTTSLPALALDFPRPDWNAAVLELLIGLTAVAFAPRDHAAWLARWRTPPSRDELEERLGRLAFAFDLDGDGPRAFQDFDALEGEKVQPIRRMIGGAASENAEDLNTDHFIKRDKYGALCWRDAAAALVAQQVYTPTGGRGYRGNVRCNGPLTTLVRPRRDRGHVSTMWELVWANVPLASTPPPHPDADRSEWASVFPWLAPTRAFAGQDDGHPFLDFFATPRRIRLRFEAAEDTNAAGAEGGAIVREYLAKAGGADYKSQVHPLTPYHSSGADKKAHKPRATGATYRDWLGIWGVDADQAATVVRLWADRAIESAVESYRYEIEAFGFVMDKANAKQWVQSRVPGFAFSHPSQADGFHSMVSLLVGGAERAANSLTWQAMLATRGRWSKDGSQLEPPDARVRNAVLATLEDLAERFWRETEDAFRALLGELYVSDPPDDADRGLRTRWRDTLCAVAHRIFDSAVGEAGDHAEDLKRVVLARGRLSAAFADRGARKSASVTDALGLLAVQPSKRAEEGTSA